MKESKVIKRNGIVLIIFLVIFLLFVFLYVVRSNENRGYIRNSIGNGYISFDFAGKSNVMFLKNIVPIHNNISNVFNSNENYQDYLDFNVSFITSDINKVGYEIYLTKQEVKNQIDEKYIKVSLIDKLTNKPLDGYDKDIPSYANLQESIVEKNSKQLYRGLFANNGVQSFRLRMWVANNYMNFSGREQFKVKVNVKPIG